MRFVELARAIGILNRTFQNQLSGFLSDKDLSFSDSVFLVNISDTPGISQEELAYLLVINKAAVARSVKNLEEKGYIRTERSTVDKRAKKLFLTERGTSFFGVIRTVHERWNAQLMDGMDPNDLEVINKGMALMSDRARSMMKGTLIH